MADEGNCEHEFNLRVWAENFGPTSDVPYEEAGVGDIGEGRIAWHVCLGIVVVESDGVEYGPLEALGHQGAIPCHADDMWKRVGRTW